LSETLGSVVDLNLDPTKEMLEDEEIGRCELSVENLREKCDIFLIGHVMGYAGKTILFRDCGFSWLISISWELTEMLFCSVLPNFVECWWDIVLFDVMLCNASGIILGCYILNCLNIPFLQWNRYWDNIEWRRLQRSTLREKGHEVYKQTSSISNIEWTNVFTQGLWSFILLFFTNTAELNSFTLKRVFGVHKNHPLNIVRLLTHALMSYKVITNYRHYLRGTMSAAQLPVQFWCYLAIVAAEFAAAVYHGAIFTLSTLPNIAAWIAMLCLGSVVYSCLASLKDFRNCKANISHLDAASPDLFNSSAHLSSQIKMHDDKKEL